MAKLASASLERLTTKTNTTSFICYHSRMDRRYLPRDVQELAQWYQRYLSPLALVLGFVADNILLLRRVDLLRTHLLLVSYLIIAALGIILLNAAETGRVRQAWLQNLIPIVPVGVQFAFGGLFSGYLSLYSRSASFVTTWIFVFALGILLLGNERFFKLYTQYAFQVGLYFVVLLGYFAFMIPVVVRMIGPNIFLLSCAVSVGAIVLFLYALAWVTPEISRRELTRTARSIAVILVVFNILYFSNAIPPLPLSLKGAGVYHSVTRESDGTYTLAGESQTWLDAILGRNVVFHQQTGDRAYVFTAVFAPTGLSTPVVHQWQYYDVLQGAWVTTDTLTFTINGGRDGGYRGYSRKGGLTEGAWRVNVLTSYGQLIGRVAFAVMSSTSSPELVSTSE